MNRILVYGIGANVLGGIETFLFNMNSFMSNDVVFDYIIEGDCSIHEKMILERGGKVYYISPKRKPFSNIRDWKKLLKKCRSEYDIIYFNLFSLAWLYPIKKARAYKYNVYVHAHNGNLHNCGLLQKSLHYLNRFFQRFLKINRLTNSDLSSRFFFGKSKSTLIYNAIDLNRFQFDDKIRKDTRGALSIDDKSHLYGFSGRLSFEKNCFFLLDVFKEISKIDCRSKFILCGEGKLKGELQKKAEENDIKIIFAGSVNNIQNYYFAMDAFVLPSRFEGLGIVLIESQASGLVSFASNYVIPSFAKQTDLLTFIDLKDGPQKWAQIITNELANRSKVRLSPRSLRSSRFNIEIESKYLERCLLSNK